MPIFQNILLLVAMEVEAKAIINKLNLAQINGSFDPDLPMQAYQSISVTPLKITLVYSGKCKNFKVDRIGKEAAVLMAWESIKIFHPDLIISVGTAGGFQQKGADIGDVYISNLIQYHDRLFHPVTALINYGIGTSESYNLIDIATKIGLKSGNISTGNSLMPSQQETEQMEKNNAELKEMEAAAIAEVANLKKIPVIAIKVVTDFVDSTSSPEEQFYKNYKMALQNLSQKLDLFTHELAQYNG